MIEQAYFLKIFSYQIFCTLDRQFARLIPSEEKWRLRIFNQFRLSVYQTPFPFPGRRFPIILKVEWINVYLYFGKNKQTILVFNYISSLHHSLNNSHCIKLKCMYFSKYEKKLRNLNLKFQKTCKTNFKLDRYLICTCEWTWFKLSSQLGENGIHHVDP